MGNKKEGNRSNRNAGAAVKRPDENLVMAEIGRIINSSLPIDEVFAQVGDQIKKLIPFDRFRINLLDQETDLLRNVFVSGLDIPAHRVGNLIPRTSSSAVTALESRQVCLVQGLDEAQISTDFPGMLPGFRAGLKSFLVVPLIFDDAVIGTIGIQSLQPRAYSNDDVLLAERAGSLISAAIVNVQLFSDRKRAEEAQRRLADENAVIAEIGIIISSSVDISEVYAHFGQVVSNLLPFDRISVSIADMEKGEAHTAYAWGDEIVGRKPGDVFALAGSTTEKIVREHTAVVSGAAGVKKSANHGNLSDGQIDGGMRSFIAVPLRTNNETKGSLQIHSRKIDIYDDEHVRLLKTIGDQVSGAIANSQLYAEIAASEENLRNSENKLRAIFESTASGILTIDARGIIEDLNSAAETIFGYTAHELIGQNVSLLMPEPYRSGHQSYISNSLVTGHRNIIGLNRDLEGLKKSGDVFPMELVVSEVELDGERFFTGIVRDITTRKQSELEFQKMATIVESVDDPIIAIDRQMRITVWNHAAVRTYGYSKEEAMGRNIKLLSLPHNQAQQISNASKVQAGTAMGPHETQKSTKTGEIFDVNVSAAPLVDRGGAVVGSVGIHRDITAQKLYDL